MIQSVIRDTLTPVFCYFKEQYQSKQKKRQPGNVRLLYMYIILEQSDGNFTRSYSRSSKIN